MPKKPFPQVAALRDQIEEMKVEAFNAIKSDPGTVAEQREYWFQRGRNEAFIEVLVRMKVMGLI